MNEKNKVTITFGNKIEAVMYSLRAGMGTTFGLYASLDQMAPNEERLAFVVPLWAPSPDKNFSNFVDVNIIVDTSYTAGSITSIKQFESDWLTFINDPRGCGQAGLSAWYYDEIDNLIYIGFRQDGADDHVDPDNPMTWYEEWGYDPDPTIWLRVAIKPHDLENFVQLQAHYFWSTRYQLRNN